MAPFAGLTVPARVGDGWTEGARYVESATSVEVRKTTSGESRKNAATWPAIVVPEDVGGRIATADDLLLDRGTSREAR